MRDSLLPDLEPECAGAVQRQCRQAGVHVRTAHRFTGADVREGAVFCRILDIAAREERTIAADGLLLALGRRPAVRDLGLESVEVVTDRRGRIQVDGTMATATPGLYAVGDLVPTPQLRHLAAREGRIAALHAAGRPVAPVRHRQVPQALDTWPPLATVGATATEARGSGHLVAEGRQAAVVHGDAGGEGFVKVVVDAENERLLGVQVAGVGAEQLISACVPALDVRVDEARQYLSAGGPLDASLRVALDRAREVAPAVRAHVATELERRPLSALPREESGRG
jgi:dihydrolipoamide dehydrogenase